MWQQYGKCTQLERYLETILSIEDWLPHMEVFSDSSLAKARRVFPELTSPGRVKHYAPSPSSAKKKARNSLENIIGSSDQIRATTLSMQNMHHHGSLLVNYLKARREVFIVAKGWQLPQTEGMEFDQYDTPQARWIVVHQNGKVLAGIRVAPTTARCGLHSYMIRDAQLGLLQGLPLDPLFFEAPVADNIWEATRLFVIDDVPAQQRAEVQRLLMLHMAATARDLGADQVIGIVPAVFKRWLKRIGMSAMAVGPTFELDGDKSQAALFNVSEAPEPDTIA
ncbi:acyl-homoserine-lactone synthase [Thioclava indica]|nr:acyl-homoserine-lactone synthase [Thioclava indica]